MARWVRERCRYSSLAAVVSAKAKADQPFSPAALADRLLGDVHARIADKLKTVIFNYRAAAQADQQFAKIGRAHV